jgi:hypothetical protein
MKPKGTSRTAPAEEDGRFKEGLTGDGDAPRSLRRRLPNRGLLQTFVTGHEATKPMRVGGLERDNAHLARE